MPKEDWYELGQGWRSWLKAGLKGSERFGVVRGDLRCHLAGGLTTRGQNSVGQWANTETGVTKGSKMQTQGWEWQGWVPSTLEQARQASGCLELVGGGLSGGKKPEGHKSLEDQFRGSGGQSTSTNAKDWEQPRGGWFWSASVCKDWAKELGTGVQGLSWLCQGHWRGNGPEFWARGYKVWARTTERSTGWDSRSTTTGVVNPSTENAETGLTGVKTSSGKLLQGQEKL
ncbi:hypothetical protein BKA82DRAFT_4018742 [Pisolithus tinctorius]|nr:hypothetical protein BKA82DRAFT_4018742 [Pisolithus tinctorius]